MSSKTPWPLRESDPLWRNDHNYSTGAIRTGSDGAMYTALKPSGPNTADGPKDPVSSPDHWESLKASLMSGGSNEISASDLGAVSVSGDSVAPMAAKLETARKISISGDASGSTTFDGSADRTISFTLASTGVTAGSYGPSDNATPAHKGTFTVPQLTVDAKGRVTRAAARTITLPADTNTDTKVTQTVTTTDDDYPILTTALADASASRTEGVRFSTKVKINHSTGNITATKFTGALSGAATSCSGNAATATKLATARSVRTNLASTSAVNFDGSANITPGVTGTLPAANGGTGRTDGKVTALATKRSINGMQFDGSGNIFNYGTCSTAAGTAAKTVTLANFALATGATVWVKFTATNTHASPTLNVNGTGAKSIRYLNAALPDGMLQANGIYQCIYDGTYWQLVSGGSSLATIDPWDIFPMYVPINVFGVKFGGSDGRRAIMPGESTARENWVICDGGSDGKGGTVPDLRGRFIMGASDEYKAGSTGGSKTHSHSISGTVGEWTLTETQMPAHWHEQGTEVENYSRIPAWARRGNTSNWKTGWAANFSSSAGFLGSVSDTGSSGAHAHSMSAVSCTEASVLPLYYTLSYIVRII